MGVEGIIIIILLLCVNFFSIFVMMKERNITKLYINNYLLIDKKYYLTHKCEKEDFILLLVDLHSNKEYHIEKVIEKNIHTYFFTKHEILIYNELSKKLKIKIDKSL